MSVVSAWSQPWEYGGGRGGGRYDGGRSGGKIIRDRAGVPEWTVKEGFSDDVFTFVRIAYGSRGRGGWRVDWPAADLNFSYRLEELTSMKVNPEGLVLELTDEELFNYPFIFIIDPRSLRFTKPEADNLRIYLLNGGFLMVDDFWGERMLDHFKNEMTKVFPDRQPQSLPHDHTIFNCVYPLKEPPQVPSEDSAHATRNEPDPYRTWEYEIRGEIPRPANYWAYYDDNDRIMVLLCHNTDLSDGWEEEGISPWFFTNFSEKFSYPMGINIVFYALTH